MPEVCEVTITSQFLKYYFRNKSLKSIAILSGRYKHQKLVGLDLLKKNLPLKLVNVESKGKFMWMELKDDDTSYYIMNTFGLTGGWNFDKEDARLKLEFSNKTVYYHDQRNFGTFNIVKDREKLDKKLATLCPDVLKTEYTGAILFDRLKTFIKKSQARKDMKIVKLLMGQTTRDGIVSGCGNYLTPEILYEAEISPHKQLKTLTKNHMIRLSKAMKHITKQCYLNNETDYMEDLDKFVKLHYKLVKNRKLPNYHPTIIIKPMDKFVFHVYRQKKTPNGEKVKAEKILNNRTTYWVPSVQS